jgi:hypothetical protein
MLGGYRGIQVNYVKEGFLFDTTLHKPIFGLTFKVKQVVRCAEF